MLVSIGIIAWNEEDAIAGVVASLSKQTLFREITDRGLSCEVLIVANGCTDRTCEVAQIALKGCFGDRQTVDSPQGGKQQLSVSCTVVSLSERGKLNAWNEFVHRLSSQDARFLILLDADIDLNEEGTLWSLVSVLRQDAKAAVAVDTPVKRFSHGIGASLRRLSRSATMVTAAAPAQLCGQLYCIRAEVARNIYLPKDLAACDDGFIKALVCTDGLTRPLSAERIRVAPNASHTFEAYVSPAAVLRNQKRQIIGQTIVHLLIDKHLQTLAYSEKLQMASTLRNKDASDPGWLKRLIAQHVCQAAFPWRLYPGLLTHRFRHLARLNFGRKVASAPGLLVGLGVSLLASCMAFRALKRGSTDYWPKTRRTGGHQGASFQTRKLNLN